MEGEVLSLAALHIISVSNVSGVTYTVVSPNCSIGFSISMEQLDLLNPVNEVHIFALHYVYIPHVNKSLQEFKNGWNHHPIRTERNYSPHQLFVEGALSLQRSGIAARDFFDRVDDFCGMEQEGLTTVDDDEGVAIPESQFGMRDEHYRVL